MSAQDVLRENFKQFRIEHDKSILESIEGATYSLQANPTFEDKVKLKKGFTASESITCTFSNYDTVEFGANGLVTIDAKHDYINIGYSTVRIENAHFTGNPTFDNKITLDGGFKTAASVNAEFGNYVTLTADNDYLKFNNSTINGSRAEINLIDATIKSGTSSPLDINGKVDLRDATLKADNSVIDFDGGSLRAVAASLDADSIVVDADKATISASNSSIKIDDAIIVTDAQTSVTGNLIFCGTPKFNNPVTNIPTADRTTKGGVKIGDGLFMDVDTLKVDNNFNEKTVFVVGTNFNGGACFNGNITLDGGFVAQSVDCSFANSSIAANKASVSCNVVFTGSPKFNAGTEIKNSLALTNTTISGDPFFNCKSTLKGAKIYNGTEIAGSVDLDGATIKGFVRFDGNNNTLVMDNSPSIHGSPYFVGVPTFSRGFYMRDSSNLIDDIRIENGKLKIVSGNATLSFTPD